jgi:OOP family OmpA-OmpF porin
MAGAACAALLPALAVAQPLQGLYIGAALGPNFAGSILSSDKTTKIYTGVGPAAILDLGWGFGNGLRAEIEGSYRSNPITGVSTRRIDGLLHPLSDVAGTAGAYAAMANLAYDIPYRPFGIQPYVGGGIGYTWLDMAGTHGDEPAILHLPHGNTYTGLANVAYGNAGAFAYQGFAGASLAVPGIPGLTASLEYRYFGSASIETPATTTAVGGPLIDGAVPSTYHHRGFLIGDQSVLIGLRYAFGHAPVPTPPAAEAPAPSPVSRSYLVFFDWDKYNLTDRARQIVAEAAANSTKVQYTKIEVNGYTDTSGTPKYNMGLSIRRANTVAAELVKDGVPKAAIAIQGFGETHLMVPTGPNVREPQNRRVEIIIQ